VERVFEDFGSPGAHLLPKFKGALAPVLDDAVEKFTLDDFVVAPLLQCEVQQLRIVRHDFHLGLD